jgi:predicted Zn-dependent protease
LDVQLNSVAEPVGTLDVALAHAARLLERDPRLAAEQADEILKAVPGHPHARLILGAAHRRAGRTQSALEILAPLASEQSHSAPAHLELAVALGEAGRMTDAIGALRHALQLKPDSIDGWQLLAEHLDMIGDAQGADRARAAHIKAATKDPRLMGAAAALVENNLPVAESRLRTHLQSHPKDVAALRMLAEIAARLKRYADAQNLLEKC